MSAATTRNVVALLWTGPVILRRLGPSDPSPTSDELAALADEWTPRNRGARPSVRVLEVTPSRRDSGLGSDLGTPGTTITHLQRR